MMHERSVTPDTQVLLLLCGHFGGLDLKPLTPTEYNRIAKELLALQMRPCDLLDRIPKFLETSASDDEERLKKLLGRGAALALALERWEQLGIKVIGRSDPLYPRSLKTRLKASAPPLLYGVGPWNLLSQDAICVVGSRDATPSGLRFARDLGKACAHAHVNVVSGDARGIDREAMNGALDAGGNVIGVLADSLSKAAVSKRNRKAIMDGLLLLISPFAPEAGFSVGNAMHRNRYLYSLSRASVVVDSDTKGGTWTGAIENKRNDWVPSYVRVGPEVREGNALLASHGITPMTEDEFRATKPITRLFDTRREPSDATSAESTPIESGSASSSVVEGHCLVDGQEPARVGEQLYIFFVSHLVSALEKAPQSEEEIATCFEVEPLQAKRWLRLACEQGLVTKSEGNSTYARSSNAVTIPHWTELKLFPRR